MKFRRRESPLESEEFGATYSERSKFIANALLSPFRPPTTPAREKADCHALMKSKGLTEAQFLELLQKVLPQATSDPHLASSIFEHVAQEIRLLNHLKSFEKFCAEGSLPDLEPATVAEFENQLGTHFGAANVVVTPAEKGDAVAVEIVLPDKKINNRLRVQPAGVEEDEEIKTPFVPFPVVLPEDPDLVWVLARREDLGQDEAARALSSIEEEFWETKAGLKAQRDRVDKSFAEFISRVPAAALADSGLKRHYKSPEPRKTLHRPVPSAKADGIEP